MTFDLPLSEYLDEFGEAAIYCHGGKTYPIKVIYHDSYIAAGQDGNQISTTQPNVVTARGDVSSVTNEGDTIELRGVVYSVIEVQANGDQVRLLLSVEAATPGDSLVDRIVALEAGLSTALDKITELEQRLAALESGVIPNPPAVEPGGTMGDGDDALPAAGTMGDGEFGYAAGGVMGNGDE